MRVTATFYLSFIQLSSPASYFQPVASELQLSSDVDQLTRMPGGKPSRPLSSSSLFDYSRTTPLPYLGSPQAHISTYQLPTMMTYL